MRQIETVSIIGNGGGDYLRLYVFIPAMLEMVGFSLPTRRLL